MNASKKSVCPKCGVIERTGITVSPRRSESSKAYPVLNEKMLNEMREQDDDYYKTVSLMNHGISSRDADIIIRFDRGRTAVSIAAELSISIADVMLTLTPYFNLLESMEAPSP